MNNIPVNNVGSVSQTMHSTLNIFIGLVLVRVFASLLSKVLQLLWNSINVEVEYPNVFSV